MFQPNCAQISKVPERAFTTSQGQQQSASLSGAAQLCHHRVASEPIERIVM